MMMNGINDSTVRRSWRTSLELMKHGVVATEQRYFRRRPGHRGKEEKELSVWTHMGWEAEKEEEDGGKWGRHVPPRRHKGGETPSHRCSSRRVSSKFRPTTGEQRRSPPTSTPSTLPSPDPHTPWEEEEGGGGVDGWRFHFKCTTAIELR